MSETRWPCSLGWVAGRNTPKISTTLVPKLGKNTSGHGTTVLGPEGEP